MKRIILTIISMLSFASFAQNFQGMAVYESKTSTSNMTQGWGGREMTPEMRKNMEERVKKAFEKTYTLNFDRNASIYVEEEKIESDNQGTGMRRMMSSFTGGGGTHYKNIKDKTFIVDKEFMGKEFLVVDSLPKYEWKLESETRQIGAYTCFKATTTRPTNMSDFRNMRRKAEEKKDEKKEGEEVAKTEEKKEEKKDNATNFMDGWEMPKEITITAWYTTDIPINQGPENYWGLPGLILEVNDGTTVILCSKIVMNIKEKKEITAPKKGEKVTQEAYDKIVFEKMQEMREMRRGGQGGGFGRGGGM
jgi:GLPGLI family protein